MRYVTPHTPNARGSGRTLHLQGSPGRTLCGEEAHRATIVPSVTESTCFYCAQEWERQYARGHAPNASTGPIQYVLKQITPDGLWVSPDVFSAETPRHVAQAVIAGALFGQPRWAETTDGRFLYGLDAKGKDMRAAPAPGHMPNARELHFAGYDFTAGPGGTRIHRGTVDTSRPGDYGADPLGDGTFRMVPSGDTVDFEERNRRLKRHTPNAPYAAAPADTHAATELVLFIENTADLALDGPHGQGRSVLLNALRKWRKGTYDPALAVKLFEYLADSGARRYVQENRSSLPWNQMFSVATRRDAARQLEESFRSAAERGEYDSVDSRVGAR